MESPGCFFTTGRVIDKKSVNLAIDFFFEDYEGFSFNDTTQRWCKSNNGIVIPSIHKRYSLEGLYQLSTDFFDKANREHDLTLPSSRRKFNLRSDNGNDSNDGDDSNNGPEWLIISQKPRRPNDYGQFQLLENERVPTIVELSWYFIMRQLFCKKDKCCHQKLNSDYFASSTKNLAGNTICLIEGNDGLRFTESAYRKAPTLVCYTN